MKKLFITLIFLLPTFLVSAGGGASNHNIGTGNLTACSGNLFDSGGSGGDYGMDENIVETYCSNNGDCISASFSVFSTESCCDWLKIYDGNSTAAPLIGTYQGTTSPGTVNSTTGCLTFEFSSDFSVADLGWEAALSCGVCPTCPDPSGLTAGSILANSAILSWTENGSATIWDIELGPAGFSPTGTPTQNNVTTTSYTYTGLSSATSYDYYVRSDCGGALQSAWVGPFNFISSAAPAGTDCGSAYVISTLPFSQTNMTTNGYNNDYSSSDVSCNSSYMDGDDYVFKYTPSVCQQMTIALSNTSTTYGGVFLLDDCPGSGNCVSSATGGTATITNASLVGGVTYYIVVSTWPSPQTIDFDINISATNVSCPGDEPCSAIPATMSCGVKNIGSIGGLTNSGVADPGCGDYQGGDLWFSTTVPASGNVDFEAKNIGGGIADLAMAVYVSGFCGGGKTLLSCDDNSGDANMPLIHLRGLTPGNTLYIRCWEPGNNASGLFELEITEYDLLFCLTDDASMYNLPTDTCMQITGDLTSQRGCAWYKNTIDFSQSFDHTLEIYCGNDDGGADGMTFTFHNDPQGTNECGNDGQYLGAGGIQNAVVIEIDTWDNGGSQDIADDHISIWTSNSGEGAPIAGPVPATSPASNIEDGLVHALRITWDASTYRMEVYFDGVFRLSVTNDFVANVFGSENVFWGSTGSTGGASNQHYVCPPNSLISVPLPLDENLKLTSLCVDERPVLSWTVPQFRSEEQFNVQESDDGKQFTDIATDVKADSKGGLEFNWPVQSRSGLENAYYRIQKVVPGNTVEWYSNAVQPDCGMNFPTIVVYPNPVENTIFVRLNSIYNESLHYELKDVLGREIIGNEVEPYAESFEIPLDDHLAKGHYVLMIRTRNALIFRKTIRK